MTLFCIFFSFKVHALLCRPYSKGRDWYDFLWFAKQARGLNLVFLKHALFQWGPYRGQSLEVSESFVKEELKKKVEQQHWDEIKSGVARFLVPGELGALALWSRDLFWDRVEKLKAIP